MASPDSELRRRNQGIDENFPSNRGENENSPVPVPTTSNSISYGSANEYANAVRAWLWAYHTWHFSQLFTPVYAQQFLCQQQQRSNGQGTISTNSSAFFQAEPVAPAPVAPSGNRYIVPAFGRRIIAEGIDFIVCFVFSLLVTYILVELEIIELSRYEKLLSDQADLKTLIDVTQELFPIEIGKKILTSILEALFITYGFSAIPPGASPGKYLMGLKVIRCDRAQVVAPRDYRVLIFADGERISFMRAFIRSLIKNFALGFLFPLCITMYVFQFNRALYDIIAGTIVVEA